LGKPTALHAAAGPPAGQADINSQEEFMTSALDAILRGPGTPVAVLVALDGPSIVVHNGESATIDYDEFEEHRLLTPEEAAEYLAVGRDAIYQQIDSGRLRSLKIGASRRIPRQALVDFVKASLEDAVTGQE
jgi:excisionase family DNA binding protein